jgi:hypothetical protein
MGARTAAYFAFPIRVTAGGSHGLQLAHGGDLTWSLEAEGSYPELRVLGSDVLATDPLFGITISNH